MSDNVCGGVGGVGGAGGERGGPRGGDAVGWAAGLGVLRAGVMGLWVVYLMLYGGWDLVGMPLGSFRPPGVAGWPGEGFWGALLGDARAFGLCWAVLLSLCTLGMLGVGRRWVLVAAAVGLTLHQGLLRGFGHINHGELAPLYMVWVLCVFPCYDGFVAGSGGRVRGRGRSDGLRPADLYESGVQMVQLVLLLTYCMVGAHRLAFGGLDLLWWDTSTWLARNTLATSEFGWMGGEWGLVLSETEWGRRLFHAGFLLITLVEILCPLVVVYRRLVWAVVGLFVVFHVGSMLALRILFWENMVLLILVFLPWSVWLRGAVRGGGAVERILFFDGVCNLCNRAVDWVIRHDDAGVVKFSPLGSEAAKARGLGEAPAGGWSSVIYWDGCRLHERSSAILRMVWDLGGGWRAVWALALVPRVVRDAVYGWVAVRRYAWFGKRSTCRVPTAEERSRFLD